MKKHFVYVLRSIRDQKFYIGQTDVLPEDRLRQHNSGKVKSTQKRRPFELIYYEMYRRKEDAIGREAFLKSGSGHTFLRKQLRHFFDQHRGVEQPGSSQGSKGCNMRSEASNGLLDWQQSKDSLSNSVKPVDHE